MVFTEIIPYNISQSVKSIAHICRLTTQKIAQVGA